MIKMENNVTTVGIDISDVKEGKVNNIVIHGGYEDIAVAAVQLLVGLAAVLSREGDTADQTAVLGALYFAADDVIRQQK